MTDPMKGSPDRITSTKPRPQRSMDPAVHPAVQASEGRRKGPHVMVHKDLLAQLHERLSDARALLAEKDAEIEALEAERDNLQRWWREVSDEAKQLRARITKLEAQEVTADMVQRSWGETMVGWIPDTAAQRMADCINAALRSDSEEATNDR